MEPEQEQWTWEHATLSPEAKEQIRTFDAAYREAVRWIEGFACNQAGQDKSWVARVEENERLYFASARLVIEP
jgi:hypothetical protein